MWCGALWAFYVFDWHSRNEKGALCFDCRSVLICVETTVNELATFLRRLANSLELPCFEATTITIVVGWESIISDSDMESISFATEGGKEGQLPHPCSGWVMGFVQIRRVFRGYPYVVWHFLPQVLINTHLQLLTVDSAHQLATQITDWLLRQSFVFTQFRLGIFTCCA